MSVRVHRRGQNLATALSQPDTEHLSLRLVQELNVSFLKFCLDSLGSVCV
jgi:hypothetical protein